MGKKMVSIFSQQKIENHNYNEILSDLSQNGYHQENKAVMGYTLVINEVNRMRQEDHEFENSLGYNFARCW
jgi:hypothetical protein